MYIWTHAKHVWNDGTAATAWEAQLDANLLCPSPCPLQSGGGYPSWPAPQELVDNSCYVYKDCLNKYEDTVVVHGDDFDIDLFEQDLPDEAMQALL